MTDPVEFTILNRIFEVKMISSEYVREKYLNAGMD